MKESIFYSAIRSFFNALACIAGLLIGLFLVTLLISSFSDTKETTPPNQTFTTEIVPNANGVRKNMGKTVPVILQLNVDGIIGLDGLTTNHLRTQLIESREGSLDSRVKALLIHINTPGGTVVDSDGIYRAIKAYKKQYNIPVYAYVDGMCASGGMYIACAADKVFASDVSIIGSVGVVSPTIFNVNELINKVGVHSLTLYAGKGKEDLNPFRPWKVGEQEMYQGLINFYYNQFLDLVTSNRPKINPQALIDQYGAAVFPAPIAKEHGYIDENGATISEVIKELVQKMGIEDDQYQVIQLEKKTWYSELFGAEFSLLKGNVKHSLELAPELNPKLMNQFLYLYRP
jgi:protease-4